MTEPSATLLGKRRPIIEYLVDGMSLVAEKILIVSPKQYLELRDAIDRACGMTEAATVMEQERVISDWWRSKGEDPRRFYYKPIEVRVDWGKI